MVQEEKLCDEVETVVQDERLCDEVETVGEYWRDSGTGRKVM